MSTNNETATYRVPRHAKQVDESPLYTQTLTENMSEVIAEYDSLNRQSLTDQVNNSPAKNNIELGDVQSDPVTVVRKVSDRLAELRKDMLDSTL